MICDVPGIPKDRIHIQVKDDMICIDGKRKKKVITDNDTYLMTERKNGPFKRVIKVHFALLFQIDAKYLRHWENCSEA